MKSKRQKQLTPDHKIHEQLQARFEYGAAKRKEKKESLAQKSPLGPVILKKKQD